MDFDCPNQRRCIRGCTCPSRTGALSCLARIYTHYSKSQNEVDAVVRGHMAVLFGLLMERSPANQHTLLNALSGLDSRSKLGTLLQHAQDFTLFYVALSRKMAEAQSREEGAEEESEDTVDAHSSVSGSALRDTKGEAVAKGVVAFLRRLRDDS